MKVTGLGTGGRCSVHLLMVMLEPTKFLRFGIDVFLPGCIRQLVLHVVFYTIGERTIPAVVSRARGASPGTWNLEGDCFSEVSGEQTVRGELLRRKRTGIVRQRRRGICAQPGLPGPLEAAGDCLAKANDGVVMAGNGVEKLPGSQIVVREHRAFETTTTVDTHRPWRSLRTSNSPSS